MSPAKRTEEVLVPILEELARELHPRRRRALRIDLDSALERDLGIDSLARVELLLRLERHFGVHIEEAALMETETVRDLLAALEAAGPKRAIAPETRAAGVIAGGEVTAPHEAGTLLDAMEYHLTFNPDRPHLRYLDSAGAEQVLTYAGLWEGAEKVARGLREALVQPGEAVAIMLTTGLDFFFVFLGSILAGGVPVPIYPPARRSQIEEHLRRQAGILRNARARVLVTTAEAHLFGRVIQAQVETLTTVTTPDQLATGGGAELRPTLTPDTVALMQYTSGSTGDPKGVVLSHANLLANIRGLGVAFDVTSDDVVVSWLPLYHDMGLIGAWLGSLYFASPFVVMSPLSFLARPERWLWAIHRYRGTLSAAPNFAYELCLGKVSDADIAGLDLSSWRMAGNGAEAVRAGTTEAFARRYAAFGFRREALMPMYGLAESSVALTVSPLGRGVWIDHVDRSTLARTGHAAPAAEDDPNAIEFVSCGPPLAGHEIRIVDAAGRELGNRQQGRLQSRGPSITRGYYRNPEKTAELFDDGWLNTGDVGYIDSGEVFITGRSKDIIVRAGRNLYPEEIENAVSDLEGVRKGRVAVFAASDPRAGTERLVVVAETRVPDDDRRAALEGRIREVVTLLAEMPPEDIMLARPGTVLKTANGKVRRAACQALYESHRLGRAAPALWRQAAGLLQASVRPVVRRWRQFLSALLYALRFQASYRAVAPFLWVAMMVIPGRARRRRVFRCMSTLLVRLMGIVPAVSGLHGLPRDEPWVLVGNHESYLDGLILAAILPAPYTFTVKREMTETPIAGRLLRRLGVAFIERLDMSGSVEDTRNIVALLKTGEPVIVFPEGTFDRRPGLRMFQMGAFVVAAQAGVPVVPVAITGTRAILREDNRFARRGRISVHILPAMRPRDDSWESAVALRDEARQVILERCGEPDLIEEPTLLRLRAIAGRQRKPD